MLWSEEGLCVVTGPGVPASRDNKTNARNESNLSDITGVNNLFL